MDRLPDFVETHLKEKDYFTFLLPVTAFGYQDDMIMEVSIEYGSPLTGHTIRPTCGRARTVLTPSI